MRQVFYNSVYKFNLTVKTAKKPWDGGTQGEVTPCPGGWTVKVYAGADVAIIAHEAAHVALYAADHYNLPIEAKVPDCEPLAYLTGWAAECIADALART
jgi:hypothetical protein